MSWSVDLMGLPIKLHPMSPVMDGTNSLAGSAPHPRSISGQSVPLIFFVPQSVTAAVSFTFYILSLYLFCFPLPALPSQQEWQSPPSWLSAAACGLSFPPHQTFHIRVSAWLLPFDFSNAVLIIFCWKSFPFYWYTYYTEDWVPQGYCHTST